MNMTDQEAMELMTKDVSRRKPKLMASWCAPS